MDLKEYLNKVCKESKTGKAQEHSYRGFLKDFLESLDSNIIVINEPGKTTNVGKPDYLVQKDSREIGYIEAKNVDVGLDKTEKSDQLARYLGLNNLILTNYLEFRFYRNGEKTDTFKLASLKSGELKIYESEFERFEQASRNFITFSGEKIKSSEKLAHHMALKARGIKYKIQDALKQKPEEQKPESVNLKAQLKQIQKLLIRGLKKQDFADMYAQTITYGLFIARLHDKTLESFSRKKATDLIPETNPFLRKFFQYISGDDLDKKISWIIDDLAEMYAHTDVEELLKNFGKSTGKNDPFLHFYEDFLKKYDKKTKDARGAYYTPEPVVNFIVRVVDEILQKEFNLARGLADTSKVEKGKSNDKSKETKQEKEEIGKVQILDPATGTGTFLAETIKHIYTKFKGQEGMWDSFVTEDLIPRLYGFEISMVPYTMAHLKLELLLKESMQKKNIDKRLNVYLTNSLEEAGGETEPIAFARWLSDESNEANKIKNEAPIMCVIGNPPYSVSSSNKNKWIKELMEDYTKGLSEKNIQPLSDDYIKFIRYGQYSIDKNGEGVLAYISNNSFIDGIIHNQMRKHLLQSFDKIYILDLHGNTKKKETAPDGSIDQNVFDIQQGVSINFFVKTGQKKQNELGKVFHCELYGKREHKYEMLKNSDLHNTKWVELQYEEKYYLFVPKDFTHKKEWDNFFDLKELFKIDSAGVSTARDSLIIQNSKEDVKRSIKEFTKLNAEDARTKFNLGEDTNEWSVERAQRDLLDHDLNEENIVKISYKPFDTRYIFYTKKSKGFISRPRYDVMQHFFRRENLGICLTRTLFNSKDFKMIFVTPSMIDKNFYGFQTSVFPLYIYPEEGSFDQARIPNLNEKIVQKISEKLDIPFTEEKENTSESFKSFAPVDILDYIYALLHSPAYREKYREFLKIGFPKVPFPKNKDVFWKIVKIGSQIRDIHLLKSPVLNDFITQFPVSGDNCILNKKTVRYTPKDGQETGQVWINETQYFDDVPEIAWNFYIGGYQPAQKWLKDRSGRKLSHEDIEHYQKVIKALAETSRLMKEVDKIAEV